MDSANTDLTGHCCAPFISILMPAFKYPDGIVRILSNLNLTEAVECEVLIYDNSPNDEVEFAVKSWSTASGIEVSYIHNQPPTEPGPNWNSLLDSARGEYCLLLHHDEFPIGDHFVRDLVAILRKHPDTDVVMLDCVLVAPNTGRNRRHLPTWLRALVVNHFPQYLYRRNVIGPTAALVIRRSMYPRFDTRLRWLVDVDVYVRLLRVAKHLRLCPNIQIGSMLGRSDSITARLGSSIPKTRQDELAYLRDKSPTRSLWLGPYPNQPLFHGLLRALEAACWWCMRGLTRIAAPFHPGPIARSEARRALQVNQKP